MSYTPGEWEFETESDDCGDMVKIRMGTARDSRSSYEPQHIIEYPTNGIGGDGEQWEEAQANGRLIAAAPELLAALKACVETHCPNAKLFCGSCTEARKVIARAEGQS